MCLLPKEGGAIKARRQARHVTTSTWLLVSASAVVLGGQPPLPNTYAHGKIMDIAAPPQPRREMFSTKVKAQERSSFAMIDCISVIDCN